jgi:hypothetical protein
MKKTDADTDGDDIAPCIVKRCPGDIAGILGKQRV